MNILKIIEEQETKFFKEFVGIIPDTDPFIINEATPEKILDWHKQSIIQILDAEIERKKNIKKEYDSDSLDYMAPDEVVGYNKAIEEDITHLTNLISKLK